MKNLVLWLCLLALLINSRVFVRADSDVASLDKENQKRCAAFETLEPPKKDLPTPAQEATLSHCDAEADYYGIGRPKNYVRARHCAFAQIDRGEDGQAFGGSGILMGLYANGFGVKRNFNLACKYACSLGGTLMEIEGRLDTLGQYQKTKWHGHNYDVCTNITSGFNMGVCMGQQNRIDELARQKKMNRIARSWTPKQKIAYEALRQSLRLFIDARINNELDRSGSARALYIAEETDALNEANYQLLLKLYHHQFLKGTSAQYEPAHTAVFQIYGQVLDKFRSNTNTLETITFNGIASTESYWMEYRNSWFKFAHQVYPRASIFAIATYLTNARIKMLTDLLDNE